MTNRERNSSTDSSDRVGRCAMSTDSFLSGPDRYLRDPDLREVTEGLLLRVVLDDELFLDREIDLGAHRELVDEDAHPRWDGLEPGRDDALAVGLTSHDERGHLQRLLT